MNQLLSVEKLGKAFIFEGKSVPVLDDISFAVQEHDFVCIIGSSGCGKSTLLELIAGITIPDTGHIRLRNQDVTGKAGFCGYMPQEDLLLPWLTLINNALVPCKIRHGNIKEAEKEALKLIRDFGLDGYADYLPSQLSGGMKQRAAFLRTVMSEAEILLLDEPFANLDALTRLQMQEWLLAIRSNLRQTIIMVTHDIDEAIRLADRIYVMGNNPGPFIAEEDVPTELKTTELKISHPLWLKLKSELTVLLTKGNPN